MNIPFPPLRYRHLIEKLRAAGTSSLEQERRYINKKEVPLPVQRHPMFNI